MTKPKVSIVVVSYNQKAFIKQTLDSFLSQQVDFSYEIIIGDDASTDATPDIIQAYAKNNPAIKTILRRKNIGPMKNFIDTLQHATGKYVALCEGDDYWTDPLKLQLQANFLDGHKDYALCFHPVEVVYEDGTVTDEIYPVQKEGFTLDKLVESNFIQTNSVLYRAADYSDLPDDIQPLDWYLHLLHAKMGKIGFIDKKMAVYRKHAGGIWWSDQSQEAEYMFLKKNYIMHQRFYARASTLLASEAYRRQMQHQAIALLERVLRLDTGKQQTLLLKIVKEAPDTLDFTLNGVSNLISELYRLNYDQSQALQQKQEAIERLEQNLHTMARSASFRLGRVITKPMSVVKGFITKLRRA